MCQCQRVRKTVSGSLQNRLPRFNSGRGLQRFQDLCIVCKNQVIRRWLTRGLEIKELIDRVREMQVRPGAFQPGRGSEIQPPLSPTAKVSLQEEIPTAVRPGLQAPAERGGFFADFQLVPS